VALDFATGTVTPGEPTININAHPSIVVDVMPGGTVFRICPASCDAPLGGVGNAAVQAEAKLRAMKLPEETLQTLISRVRAVAAEPTTKSLTVSPTELNALNPSQKSEAKKVLDEVEAQRKASEDAKKTVITGNRTAINFRTSPGTEGLISVVPSGPHLWDVTFYGPKRSRDFVIDVACGEEKEEACPGKTRHRIVVVYIDSSQFDLRWSMGVAASGLRDDRVRFDAITGDSQNQSLKVTGKGSVPYVLGAFAHYCPVKDGVQWLCPSAGFGLDIPVSGLQVMVGPAIRVRPLVSQDAGFLFFGMAYGPRKVLADKFAGVQQPTVKIGTTPENVLSTGYGVSWVVGISFGFFGGEEKFKGVYSGLSGKGKTSGGS
jgi:hypothetical protein